MNHVKKLLNGRSLVLVGMMGVGKSTVGRRLAKKLSLPFVDADEAIEEAAGMHISEIFENFGESYFREGETRVIQRLIAEGPAVIATGGGAFINDITRQSILDSSLSIWLNADINILVDRVSRRNHRPLLHGKDPETVLRDLAEKRDPFYAKADYMVMSNNAPHERTVSEIFATLLADKIEI
ncbi:shikimate kinase [Sphingorhabdus lutea]|uniref:Shikimate kinase n=1 Tax=Sphingorhabdus lutea TaxID=1913578 RepID=A0A1L3JF23_9SPHN|nr:shikimate kinase [Sphingorhabdus lutea]